jgi:hypothetical protein
MRIATLTVGLVVLGVSLTVGPVLAATSTVALSVDGMT